MKKQIIYSLRNKVRELGGWLSTKKDNYPHYTFDTEKIVPLSEFTAIAVFNKRETGLKALAFLYYSEFSDTWNYFIPKESHIYGMEKVRQYHQMVEDHNFVRQ